MNTALIAASIPEGKTVAEAVIRARAFFRNLCAAGRFDPYADDDEWLDDLARYCTRLCRGDEEAAQALATEVIWGGLNPAGKVRRLCRRCNADAVRRSVALRRGRA